MAKRGRVSTESKLVRAVVQMPRKLPEPPRTLSPYAAEQWRLIIASPAGEMIGQEAYGLLATYCRLVDEAERVAGLLDTFETEWTSQDGGLERLDQLQRMFDRLAGRIASLSAKLKIAPSTRYRNSTAARVIDNSSSGKVPPWEF